jgi:two-component system nitrate/nitrite response regulator NarL
MRRPQVTVLAGDGQPLFLDAIVRVIRQDPALSLVAEVADGRAALSAIRDLRPDVALLGVPLAGLGAPRLAATLLRDGLPTRVVALLPGPDSEAAFETIAAGAAACLTRAVEPGALQRAIAAAARGETVVAPELQTGLAREIRLRHCERGPLLTTRERQVLGLVADGRSTAQIAHRLHLAPTTIKTHLGHAYEKLGVSDRASAVAVGMRRGLLE